MCKVSFSISYNNSAIDRTAKIPSDLEARFIASRDKNLNFHTPPKNSQPVYTEKQSVLPYFAKMDYHLNLVEKEWTMVLLKDDLEKKLSVSESAARHYRRSKNSSLFEDKIRSRFRWLAIFGAVCILALGFGLYHQSHRWKKKEKHLARAVKKLRHKAIIANCLGGAPIPLRLANIPFGEDTGLVLETRSIDVRNVLAPHNPALVKSGSGYDLFFRYDKPSSKARYLPFFSHIGVVSLDEQFRQEEKEFRKIELPNGYTEDPRAVWVGDQFYLIFNTLDLEQPPGRSMCLANLDPSTYRVNYTTMLDMNLKQVEKNWPPFAYSLNNEDPKLFFEYQISPRKIISLPDPQKNDLKNIVLPRSSAYLSLPWEKTWGTIRGGTPALKIGDEYLSFFHSSFSEKGGLYWYVMGAYTFQAEPPFAVTSISSRPILFRGIFDTPITNTADFGKRVIFPSGFVIEKRGDRELIQLACGENDSGIKIVTLDKQVLLDGLERLDGKEKKSSPKASKAGLSKELLAIEEKTAMDPELNRYLREFPFSDYKICPVSGLGKFYVDDIPDDIKGHLRQGIYWEGVIAELVKKYTKPGTVAIDLGAHIGIHTILMSKMVGAKGKVIAFEPQNKIFRELRRNLSLNRLDDRVIFLKNAVGHENQWVEMSVRDPTNEGGTPIGKGGDKAWMVTLDELNLNNVSFIKMDVESSELNVLRGATKTLSRNKPVIVFEILGGVDLDNCSDSHKQTYEEILELLGNLGYRVTRIFGNDFLAIPK